MRSNMGARVLSRLAVVLAATVPLLVATAPAWASAPPNDDISSATVITSLPFHDVLDISQATFDPSTDLSCVAQPQTVWYEFTPASSERVAFDASQSNQDMNIGVFTGSPQALSPVGCGSSCCGGVILDATGGTTYWIMASPICCVSVPTLDLWVYLAVPPQATFHVTGGTVDRAGNATITGTLDCTGTVPGGAGASGSVSQPLGRLSSVSANFATTIPCARAQPWTALAQPTAGRFAGGPATVNVTSFVCNIAGCSTPTPTSTTAVVKLRG
jgi:hypothetical protein